MDKRFLTVVATFLAFVFTVTNAVAQTKTHAQAKAGQKVSMRQMGMGKMKNTERWKAAIRQSDRRAAALRVHGKRWGN